MLNKIFDISLKIVDSWTFVGVAGIATVMILIWCGHGIMACSP